MLLGRLARSSSFEEAQAAALSFLLFVNIERLLRETRQLPMSWPATRLLGSSVASDTRNTCRFWSRKKGLYCSDGSSEDLVLHKVSTAVLGFFRLGFRIQL